MAVNNVLKVEKIFDGVTIGISGSVTATLDVTALLGSTVGKMAFQYYCASAGTADVEVTYKLSLDNVTFWDPTTPEIKSSITPNSTSEAGGGEYDYEFAPFWEITATESGAVAVTQFDFWLAFG